ncbi:hypothetical protein JCM14635_33120 [Megalodesulfovibrio paquesii]
MQAPEAVFGPLRLAPGDVFLDAGCGLGAYALHAAQLVGPQGVVHAFDVSSRCIETLAQHAASRGLAQLRAHVADLTQGLPVAGGTVTAALLAAVVQIPAVAQALPAVLQEMRRLLRPGGRLGILECRHHLSCTAEGLPRLVGLRQAPTLEECGLSLLAVEDLGGNYLSLFIKQPQSGHSAWRLPLAHV